MFIVVQFMDGVLPCHVDMGDPNISANRHDGTWQTLLLSGLVCRESTYYDEGTTVRYGIITRNKGTLPRYGVQYCVSRLQHEISQRLSVQCSMQDLRYSTYPRIF